LLITTAKVLRETSRSTQPTVAFGSQQRKLCEDEFCWADGEVCITAIR